MAIVGTSWLTSRPASSSESDTRNLSEPRFRRSGLLRHLVPAYPARPRSVRGHSSRASGFSLGFEIVGHAVAGSVHAGWTSLGELRRTRLPEPGWTSLPELSRNPERQRVNQARPNSGGLHAPVCDIPGGGVSRHPGVLCAKFRHPVDDDPDGGGPGIERPGARTCRTSVVPSSNATRGSASHARWSQAPLELSSSTSFLRGGSARPPGTAQLPRTPSHARQVVARFFSRRAARASFRLASSAPWTPSPVPQYISSGVSPSKAECGSCVLCSRT